MRPSRMVRAALVGGAVASLLLGVAGCGGGVDSDALAAKVRTEGDFAKAPKSVSECMADVLIKYANEDDLQDYVDGKIPAKDIKGTDGDKAEAAADKCVEEAKK